jgi:hypothetical protein
MSTPGPTPLDLAREAVFVVWQDWRAEGHWTQLQRDAVNKYVATLVERLDEMADGTTNGSGS